MSASCAAGMGAPATLDLKPYIGQLVTIDAQIGDRHASMLFDAGAGVTAITPTMASALGCSPYGRLVGHRMSGERVEFQKCGEKTLDFGGYKASSDVYVFDLMALLPEGLPELGGIVSLASFAGRPFTLDLAGQKLIIETEHSLRTRIANAKQGELRIIRGPGGPADITALVRIEATVGDLWFLLDSANLDTVIVAPYTLDQLGVSAADRLKGDEAFNLNFALAGVEAVSASARIQDIIYDGSLNEEVLSRFLITNEI